MKEKKPGRPLVSPEDELRQGEDIVSALRDDNIEEESTAPLCENEETADNGPKAANSKISFIKLVSIGMCIVAAVLISTFSWFTRNSDVSTTGMGVKVGGQNFEVTMLSNSRDGIFKDPYHIAVHDDSALYWKMTATDNLVNYNEYSDEEHPGDLGIHPGAEGVISFNVIPRTDSIALDFDFEIIGYQASYNDVNSTPDDVDDDELVMTPLSDPGTDGAAAQNLLNGHILLFEHRSGTAGNYVYSTPICSNAQMQRIMHRTVTGRDTENLVNIYWVWPNTLSTIVDASASGITTAPFCQDNDTFNYNSYTAITTNIESYPQYYLKGASSGDSITASQMGAHYLAYGDMYDQGDNEIGMRVNYILIKLSISEGTAGGGG